MIDAFVRVLRERLQDDIAAEKDALTRGSMKDYASYQHACGVIRGLELAEQHARDLLRAAEEADDQ